MKRLFSSSGSTLLETLFVSGFVATLGGIAIPQVLVALDDMRVSGATRYVAARLQRARMEAVLRSADVAMKFLPTPDGYTCTTYIDGNRNGVRSADITRGIDRELIPAERLLEQFSGVVFGALPNLPAVDAGGAAPGTDPIRLGSSNMASFSANGTSSTGTLYIHGRGTSQYAIRIFGETGKVRVLRYDSRTGRWAPL